MPAKEQSMFFEMTWTNEPTAFDKRGCDGMFIKEFRPIVTLPDNSAALAEICDNLENFRNCGLSIDGVEKLWNDLRELLGFKKPVESEDPKDTIYCHECSQAGGAHMPIYHSPPACQGERIKLTCGKCFKKKEGTARDIHSKCECGGRFHDCGIGGE